MSFHILFVLWLSWFLGQAPETLVQAFLIQPKTKFRKRARGCTYIERKSRHIFCQGMKNENLTRVGVFSWPSCAIKRKWIPATPPSCSSRHATRHHTTIVLHQGNIITKWHPRTPACGGNSTSSPGLHVHSSSYRRGNPLHCAEKTPESAISMLRRAPNRCIVNDAILKCFWGNSGPRACPLYLKPYLVLRFFNFKRPIKRKRSEV